MISFYKNGNTLTRLLIHLGQWASNEVTGAHLTFDFVVIGVDLSLRFLPVDEPLRLVRHEARRDGPLLPVLLLL